MASHHHQSLGEAAHEPAPTMRAGSNGKTLACASSFAATHPSCDSAASMRRNGFGWVPTPGSAVLRTASPGVTHGAVSPRLEKLDREPHGKA
mgnify:CR=1 FL=1